MKCPYCGTENNGSVSNCSNCGAELKPATNMQSTSIESSTPSDSSNDAGIKFIKDQLRKRDEIQEKKNERKWRRILALILFVIIALSIVEMYIKQAKQDAKSSNNSRNNNAAVNKDNKKTDDANKNEEVNENQNIDDTKCQIEDEHIHISDLTDEELKNLNIQTYKNDGIRLYTDTKIKSIIYNGKTYDYQDVIAMTSDFDKFVDFAYENTDYYRDSTRMSNEKKTNKDTMKEYMLTSKNSILTGIMSMYFYNTKPFKNDNYSKENSIRLVWRFSKSDVNNDRIETTNFGKLDKISTYINKYVRIVIDADDEEMTKHNQEENLSLVLEDDRIVHLFYVDENKSHIKKLHINGYKYEEEDEKTYKSE